MSAMKTNISTLTLSILFFVGSLSLYGQQAYVLADSSSMSITGTSTMHDWESTVNEIEVEIEAQLESDKPDFQKFNLTVPVKSIESHKSKMDKKTYEALKEKEHPHIIFHLTSVESVESDTVTAHGDLTIAGETKPVTLKAAYSTVGPGGLHLKGAYSLNMTNYKVDPPSVMFGTIKAGEQVTIHYNLYLKSVNL